MVKRRDIDGGLPTVVSVVAADRAAAGVAPWELPPQPAINSATAAASAARASWARYLATTTPASRRNAKPKKVVIGRIRIIFPAGHSQELTFRLNARGARLLRKLRRLRVTVTIISASGRNKPVMTSKTLAIKMPRAKHRRH